MKIVNYLNLKYIKYIMLCLNFIVITYMGWVILSTTNYVVSNSLATVFLTSIKYLPHRPEIVYFATTIAYLCLCVIILYFENSRMSLSRSIMIILVELVIYFIIAYYVYFGYTGLILVIFIDFIVKIEKNHNIPWVLGIMFIIATLTRYNVISALIDIPSFANYIEFSPDNGANTINFIMSIFDATNFLLFIIYLIIFISHQIIENERITNELEMLSNVNVKLEEYAHITEKIGENNERKRLARELHDTLGHALTGIAAGIDACITLIDIDVEVTKKQLNVLSKVVRTGIGDVRNSLEKLRPDALKESTLHEALVKVVDNFKEVSNIEIILDYNLPDIDLDNLREDAIFRTIQEAITNAKRHGNASLIKISISWIYDSIVIVIKDNGVGCGKVVDGYGLKQMKERIHSLNGEIFIEHQNGFTLTIKMKLPKEKINDKSNDS